MNKIALVGLISAAIWGGIALTTMWWEYYEFSAISFMLVALSIYFYEKRK